MKRFISLLLIITFAAALCTPRVSASADGILNVSEITEEQAELCAAVMIDGFEAEECVRKSDAGTSAAVTGGALEGERCLSLSGTGHAGVTLTPEKKRNTANVRSLCVCLYAEPADGEYTVTVTLHGEEKDVSGSAALPSGVWCAAYLPVDTQTTVNIKDIRVSVSAGSARVKCRVDRVHTALVDGLPDRLPFFASDFSAERGDIEYKDGCLIYTPTGRNSKLESSACGYMTNGLYNALAVRLVNDCDAQSLTVRFKLDRQVTYSDENAKTLPLTQGENVYYFNIDGFQSGTTVNAFRFEFPDNVNGSIKIKSIGFASYRFPAEYKGTVTAYVSGGKIIVSGGFSDAPASTERICLYRLAPGVDEELPGAFDGEPYRTAEKSDAFKFEIPLTDGKTNNAYFKYLVRYEGKNGYEDAGASYVVRNLLPALNIGYKGTLCGADLSLLYEQMPASVYVDVNTASLFSESGEVCFDGGGMTHYIFDEALSRLDAVISRCKAEDARVVLKINYSPFLNGDKYVFQSGDELLPDITTADGADFYLSFLSFLSERYSGALSGIIPCGELDSEAVAAARGLTPDRAEKYASALIISAQNVLSEYGVAVLAPVSYGGAAVFAELLSKDVSDAPHLALYTEVNTPDEAAGAVGVFTSFGFGAAVACPVKTADDLITLYYGCQNGTSICAVPDADGELPELFSVIDTTYGLTAADAAAGDAFTGGVASYCKNIKTPAKAYADLGELEPASLPSAVTTLYGGDETDGWAAYDCCKGVYKDELNSEPTAAAAFDFTDGENGYASYTFDLKKSRKTLYLRLYTDYLPENLISASVLIKLYGTGGVTVGRITLNSGETTVAALDAGGGTGLIKRVTLSFEDALPGSTPRICILGIYTEEEDSSESVTEAQTDTMPEPESQIFDTAPETSAKAETSSGGGNASLYLTAICVIIAMFALCGAVILILKKKKGETK